MKYKTMIKNISLKESDFEEIKQAVAQVESVTDGEIALAITAESSSYAFWELAAALVTSLALLCCLLPLAPQIYTWLGTIFWAVHPWYLVAFYLTACGITTVLLYFLYNIPWFDSLVIPRREQLKAVSQKAMRHFAQSGVYCTREHTGVLIFVSWFEREVRIIADKGLHEKISNDMWTLISDEISDCFAKGRVKEGFLLAVNRCGSLLAENFPAHKDNPNELPDGLVVLEDD